MVIDQLIRQIKAKKNPCIVGIDPEWDQIPSCYHSLACARHEAVLRWARDVIDAVADVVPAIKPQMAFFEALGAEGLLVHQAIVLYAHSKGLLVVDDSKRGDIGNTARAYAHAHLAQDGPIQADFLTISPFLGPDSMQPFVDTAIREGKGLFVLVKTSNPGSAEISQARHASGQSIRDWLAGYVHAVGQQCVSSAHGYSLIGAVVGATFPEEARQLRGIMDNNFFLVPGYGAQGGGAEDVLPCFRKDGLGALVSSSRDILYCHLKHPSCEPSRDMYMRLIRQQAQRMQEAVYRALQCACPEMIY